MFPKPVLLSLLALSIVPLNSKAQKAPILSSCSTPNTAALTFNNGPYIHSKHIVNTLSRASANGTFFITSNDFVRLSHHQPPKLTIYQDCIYSDSAISRLHHAYNNNHTISVSPDKDLTTLSWDHIHDELWKIELALEGILGVKPALLRPRFGNYNDLVLQVAGVRGYKAVVLWDVDIGDSTGSAPAQSEKVIDDVVGLHPANLLIRADEVVKTTAEQVVPYALEKLGAPGYKLVGVSECLGIEPYQSVQVKERDSSWHC